MSLALKRPPERPDALVAAQLHDMVGDACLSLFRSYGSALRLIAPLHMPSLEIIAVVGFTSHQIRGALGLATTLATLQGIAEQPDPTDSELDDWLGELSNQLLGRLKNRLVSYQIDLHMATPMTLRGVDLRLHPTPENRLLACHFRSATGHLSAWLDTRIAPGLELIPSADPEHHCQEEGELIFL